MITIHPIRTEQDYRQALHSVSALFDNEPEPGTRKVMPSMS